MARIRITAELLEHLLDLPEGVAIIDVAERKEVDGLDDTKVLCIVLEVAGAGGGIDGWSDTEYAMQYTETEAGTSLVSAVPVPE